MNITARVLANTCLIALLQSPALADDSIGRQEMDIEEQGYALATAFLDPLPQPFDKTPEDYGMRYRDVEFETRDGLTLRGWLVEETAEKLVIMTHFGYRANRFGYQLRHQPEGSVPYDQEIEFAKVAKRLVDAGYGVLMYDLRNHGESDKTDLGVGTGGHGERFDVIAAVEYLASEAATRGKDIGLLSYCYGANTSFFAMEEDQEVFRNNGVKAMVALQPLSNGDYLKSLGVPDDLYQAAERSYQERSGGYPLRANIEDAAKFTAVPTRLVQARQDPNTNMTFVGELYENMPVEKEMYWLEEPTHREINADIEQRIGAPARAGKQQDVIDPVGLFAEFKRRKVLQGVVAYAVAAWLIIQLAIALEASLELPTFVDRWVTIAAIAGFPVAAVLAWLFEISLDGVRLTARDENEPLSLGVDPVEAAALAQPTQAPRKHSIAVLPFVDMSPDGDQEYLGDGVAEEILNALVKVTPLRVTGRTSSFSFKHQSLSVEEIGAALNVAHVLEGSVRKQGDRVRITAQLIQVGDGFHLWSETYDGDLKDIFDLQDRIAKKIVSELEILLDSESARLVTTLTKNQDAYDAFLQGRRLLNRLVGHDTLPNAVMHLEKAVALDPQFGEAWASLALAHANLPENAKNEDPAHHYAAAELALDRAERLSPGSALQAVVRSFVLCTKGDIFGAIKAYEEAYRLDPTNPVMLFNFGHALANVGLTDRGLSLLKESEKLSPTFAMTMQNIAVAYCTEKEYSKALLYLDKANRLGNVPARVNIAFIHAQQGRMKEAYQWMQNYVDDAPVWFKKRLASPFARHLYYAAVLKRDPVARWIVGRVTLARLKKQSGAPSFWDAIALATLCAPEEFFDFMRRHNFSYAFAAVGPLFYFDPYSAQLRTHKDFPQFAEDMGLVRIWQKYGWPKQVQPLPGTDGSDLQFTVS
eukprot:s1_g1064.t1